jgi:hypothetical protein
MSSREDSIERHKRKRKVGIFAHLRARFPCPLRSDMKLDRNIIIVGALDLPATTH